VNEERLALLTGAAGGIGTEVGKRLRARGFRIIAVEPTPELAERAVHQIGDGVVPVVCDLTDAAAVQVLAERIRGEWRDDLEMLVCNAGVVLPGKVGEIGPAALDRQLAVMLTSALHLISASVPVFCSKDRGHVLATVSMGGILALPGSAAYAAAKFGLRGYLASLNAELRGTGVAVSGIYPSAVDTPMLRHEARSGGSLLNFVGKVHSPAAVADAYERALDSRKLEIYVPYGDSLASRSIGALPWLLPPLLGPLEKIGKRGRERYLAQIGEDEVRG